MTEVTKQTDRYEIGKPKYAVIDLETQKISRTEVIPPEDAAANTSATTSDAVRLIGALH